MFPFFYFFILSSFDTDKNIQPRRYKFLSFSPLNPLLLIEKCVDNFTGTLDSLFRKTPRKENICRVWSQSSILHFRSGFSFISLLSSLSQSLMISSLITMRIMMIMDREKGIISKENDRHEVSISLRREKRRRRKTLL